MKFQGELFTTENTEYTEEENAGGMEPRTGIKLVVNG